MLREKERFPECDSRVQTRKPDAPRIWALVIRFLMPSPRVGRVFAQALGQYPPFVMAERNTDWSFALHFISLTSSVLCEGR